MNFQRVSEGLHLELGFRPECISADTCLWSPSLHFCPNSFLETCLKYTFCIYRYTRKVCSQVLTDTRALSSGAGTGVLGESLGPLDSAVSTSCGLWEAKITLSLECRGDSIWPGYLIRVSQKQWSRFYEPNTSLEGVRQWNKPHWKEKSLECED